MNVHPGSVRLFLAAVVVAIALPAGVRAAEPWADARLKVTDGLAGWYDISVESAARRAAGQPRLKQDTQVAAWHDASGHGRHLSQSDEQAQPVVRADDDLRFVRFNGETTYLAADGLGLSFDEITVFLVAAPFSNDGLFRGFFALNAKDANDYVSGINFDLGPDAASKFTTLNIEGPGFGGARNLKPEPSMFGQLQRMCITSSVGADGTALYLNGKLAGTRPRAKGTIRGDRLTVGARFYTNGGPPETRGFLNGEIAELLIYNRRLSDAERAEVDRYLQTKYGDLRTLPMPRELATARPVPRVENPPAVQMLVPGFAARKLPVDLPNINNVRYRPDGKLVAMGYNGHIWLLSDSDGDGLEDRVQTFWDRPGITSPIGIALTPPGYARGQGVFVAGKGQVCLVVDTNGDDVADELVTVADGWTPLKHSVDAMGIAIAPDGSIYFGLGTEDFTNGHLLDAQGKAHYRADSQRSTIQKLSPDFKTRETVCSGVRFSVALAFNRAGDLFCTDQEGATWLPNGNPFDELLHIQPGRHYGFPPRHPQHLPEVIDEPSVYDYTPQHQSTCGLYFNEPAAGGDTFGPKWWQGNAIVCGYSRGKLYRTTLVKTEHGYVGDNAIVGCLNALTCDACVAPKGELVVATHSGGPDWGSGPGGKGQLYKISYADPAAPQPVRAWANSPHEVQLAFDRPLDPAAAKRWTSAVQIEYGPHVKAGDRFESFWPGYSVVELQQRGARQLLPVLDAQLTSDRRSLVFSTARHPEMAGYALLFANVETARSSNALPQLPAVEVGYDLTGVEARWQTPGGERTWSGWVPHLDPAAARGLLAGEPAGDRLKAMFSFPGQMTLKTQINLWQMLRPATQPGSKLDAELPPETVTAVFESDGLFWVKTPAGKVESEAYDNGVERVEWTTSAVEAWQPVEVAFATGTRNLPRIHWRTAEDPRPRAFAQRRFLLPWASRAAAVPSESPRQKPAELTGGDWQRGQDVFFSEKAQCGKCHTVRGKGGWIGPDLSNLVHRDYASVLRDIAAPSFAINPDHLAYQVVLDDGRVLTGMVQQRGDKLCVGDIKGVETEVARGSIEEMKPALLSIMPEGLPQAIGGEGMRDLLTFLLTSPPGGLEPAPIERPGAPPPRTLAEVGALLKQSPLSDPPATKPLTIVLSAGPKDHGPGEHDYPLWQKRWAQLLSRAPQMTIETADAWPSAEQWQRADVVIMFSANPAWAPERAKELDAFQARGGGLILLHYAVNGQRAPEEFARRIGLAWHPGESRFRHGELELNFQSAKPHPITAGFSLARFVDESYWNLVGDEAAVQVLATQVEEGRPRPMLWTFEPGPGRVFGSLLGHYNWTFDDPLFRVLLLRAIAWTARQPLDRFNDQVLDGARVQP